MDLVEYRERFRVAEGELVWKIKDVAKCLEPMWLVWENWKNPVKFVFTFQDGEVYEHIVGPARDDFAAKRQRSMRALLAAKVYKVGDMSKYMTVGRLLPTTLTAIQLINAMCRLRKGRMDAAEKAQLQAKERLAAARSRVKTRGGDGKEAEKEAEEAAATADAEVAAELQRLRAAEEALAEEAAAAPPEPEDPVVEVSYCVV